MPSLKQSLATLSLVVFTLFLASCATKPLQAPCDANATFCGVKTKINSW